MQQDQHTDEIPDKNSTGSNLDILNPDDDGRSKEWQDRSRVNLEQVPEGTHTSVERDFEPENLEEDKKVRKDTPPAY